MSVHYSHQTAYKPNEQTLNNWLLWKRVSHTIGLRRLYAIDRQPAIGNRVRCNECGLKIRTTKAAHNSGRDHLRNVLSE